MWCWWCCWCGCLWCWCVWCRGACCGGGGRGSGSGVAEPAAVAARDAAIADLSRRLRDRTSQTDALRSEVGALSAKLQSVAAAAASTRNAAPPLDIDRRSGGYTYPSSAIQSAVARRPYAPTDRSESLQGAPQLRTGSSADRPAERPPTAVAASRSQDARLGLALAPAPATAAPATRTESSSSVPGGDSEALTPQRSTRPQPGARDNTAVARVAAASDMMSPDSPTAVRLRERLHAVQARFESLRQAK